MKRSFAEYYQQKDAPENEKKLEELQKKVATLQDPECPLCAVDLKQYYLTWAELLQKKKDLKVRLVSRRICAKALIPWFIFREKDLVRNKNKVPHFSGQFLFVRRTNVNKDIVIRHIVYIFFASSAVLIFFCILIGFPFPFHQGDLFFISLVKRNISREKSTSPHASWPFRLKNEP